MDARHKKILQSRRSFLVLELDPSLLYDKLISTGIFNQDMIEEIKSAGPRRDQARQLVIDLETRGSRAFPAFLECLVETGQSHVADLLSADLGIQPPRSLPIRPIPIPIPIPTSRNHGTQQKEMDKPDRGHISRKDEGVAYSPEKSPDRPIQCSEGDEPPSIPRLRRDSLQMYRMDARPCGRCLIINNVEFHPNSNLKNRTGSDIDCARLEKRFKSFHFIVEVKRNLTSQAIRRELHALSQTDHTAFDCCVVIILSHGTEVNHNRFPGAIHGVDGPIVPVQNITNYFNGQNCPTLQGKPKLFFIQACGGDQKDTGFEVCPDEFEPAASGIDNHTDAMPMSPREELGKYSDELDARASLPTPSDILVSYSTFPGYVSWRDTQAGSWYVETLDNVLEEFAGYEDLLTLLTMVTDKVSQISAKGIFKQMPGSFNFLRKRIFFQVNCLNDK
ncbi:caspase-9-like isoform X2 [Polyodon spathula]|uniref:caspase-9-like isoform X2 n=1 Tax=Polyodon spathula TaxID=7913 RepID=UPI001B7DB320|nr:caspase-9-like isoform X2 [Polyodon spathula]